MNCEYGQLFSCEIKPRSQHDDTLSTLTFPHGETSGGQRDGPKVGFARLIILAPGYWEGLWEEAGRFTDSSSHIPSRHADNRIFT